MKQNLPVTSRHTDIPPGITLVSKTDLKGVITYANEAFVNASGYALDELLGHSHNIVRHPDMPCAAFEDMWHTLKSGKPWRGIVKNRCKGGGYYWVDACVVPIQRNDQVIGYMSVRKHATTSAIDAAQARYRDMTAGTSKPQPRLPDWLGIRTGMRAGSLFVALLMLAGGALGIGGLKLADNALTQLYHAQLAPITAIGKIEARLSDSRTTMMEIRLAHHESVNNHLQGQLAGQISKLRTHRDEIHTLLGQLASMDAQVAQQKSILTHALAQYTNDGLRPVEQAVAHDAPQQVEQLIKQQVLPLEKAAMTAAVGLRNALTEAAHSEYENTLERNNRIRSFAIAGIALGLAVVVLVGHMFIRGVVNPLNASIRRLNRIAQGDLQGDIDLSGTGESGQLNHAAAVMQLHLKVMLDEIALAARRIHRHCATLNVALYEVTEHSEEQHDRVYSAIRSLNAAVAETSDLSERAERLMQLADQPTPDSSLANLAFEARELATATRLTAFGADEVVSAMHQVAELIVENRAEAQRAWKASEELKYTAEELNQLVDYFEPAPTPSTNMGKS
ncbi:MAG: PAS domain-containing methyl-accepting chemotaxis protein [Comamonas sp.]|uniref:methyl-accepting chemotaxis protein n=1 Tax=Comamonas sp. TaxID=34028 RepID=UPI002FCBF39E